MTLRALCNCIVSAKQKICSQSLGRALMSTLLLLSSSVLSFSVLCTVCRGTSYPDHSIHVLSGLSCQYGSYASVFHSSSLMEKVAKHKKWHLTTSLLDRMMYNGILFTGKKIKNVTAIYR